LGDGTYSHGKVFNNELKINILIRGILTAIFAIIVYAFSLGPADSWDANQDRAKTAAMTILVISQLAFAFQCCRSAEEGFFRKFFSNKLLLGLVISVILMHLAIIYVPTVRIIFGTKPLSLIDWIPIVVAFAIFWLPLDELFTTNVDYEEEYEERSYEKREVADKKKPESEDTEEDQSDSNSETA
jgi:magnesium-transporting ATPase (P-type)